MNDFNVEEYKKKHEIYRENFLKRQEETKKLLEHISELNESPVSLLVLSNEFTIEPVVMFYGDTLVAKTDFYQVMAESITKNFMCALAQILGPPHVICEECIESKDILSFNAKHIFRIGRYYQHTSGEKLHILMKIKTTQWGDCLVAERVPRNGNTQLMAVGSDEASAENYHEITETEWMKSFE